MPHGRALVPGLLVALSVSAPVFASVIEGTPEADRLTGTGARDQIRGHGGPDRISGGGAGDVLKGNMGRDRLAGQSGRDVLRGGRGHDQLLGGPGRDLIVGGTRRDEINMRAGVRIRSPGPDLIRARDGTRDEINCGGGEDVAYVDPVEDGVYGCEHVVEP